MPNQLANMQEELAQLQARKDRLRAFVFRDEEFQKLSFLDKKLLATQFSIMESYRQILCLRIDRLALSDEEETSNE